MHSQTAYMYIMASKKNGFLYTSSSPHNIKALFSTINDNGYYDKQTKTNDLHLLVYYEQYNNINDAIARERQIKRWHRKWKIELLIKNNPQWKALLLKSL